MQLQCYDNMRSASIRNRKKVFDKITEQETVHVEDDVGDGSFAGGIGHCEMGSSFFRGLCRESEHFFINPSFQALLKTWRGLSSLFLFLFFLCT